MGRDGRAGDYNLCNLPEKPSFGPTRFGSDPRLKRNCEVCFAFWQEMTGTLRRQFLVRQRDLAQKSGLSTGGKRDAAELPAIWHVLCSLFPH